MSLHNAPPVIYPLGRSYFSGALLLGLWLAGLLLVLAWYDLTRPSGWRLVSGCAAVLVAGVAAGAGWKSVPRGQLAWDGEVWRWESVRDQTGNAEHELAVIADFQTCLLLRLQNQARASLWLWVEQRALPARWLDLRRAVYSPHRPARALPPHDLLPAEPSSLTASAASAVAVSTALHSVEAARTQP